MMSQAPADMQNVFRCAPAWKRMALRSCTKFQVWSSLEGYEFDAMQKVARCAPAWNCMALTSCLLDVVQVGAADTLQCEL